jgi:tetratricopeptide (TPR) repeat protein
MLPRLQMLTIKKRGRCTFALVAAACLSLTACGPPATRALRKGDRLIQETNYDEAITVLSRAVNLLSNNPPEVRAAAFNLLGVAYHGASNATKARQYYEEALTLNRNLAAADFNLGCLELEHTNLAAARDYLTTYTTLQKWNMDGYLKLGAVHLRLAMQLPPNSPDRPRQFENAKKDFEAAQNLARTAEAGNNLGLIDLLAKSPPPPSAISNAVLKFNVALAADPQYYPALLNLAIVYDKYLNDPHKAIAAYAKYLSLAPSSPAAKDIAVLTNNLDRSMRIQIQVHGSAPTSQAPASAEPAPGQLMFTPNKATRPPAATAPLETNPPPVAPKPPATIAPSNTPPPQAVVTPTPAPVPTPPPAARAQAPPPSITSEDLAQIAAPPVLATTVPAEQTSSPATTAPSTNPPPKKSVLAKINPINWFGGKVSPSPSDAAAVSGPVVTSLPEPAPRPTPHYTPPAAMTYDGNREQAERLRVEGATAEKESRLKDARANYQDAVKADPTDYDASLALGLVSIKAEDFATALEALHQAMTLKPDAADARYAYAWALAKKNYSQDAANELEKLLAQSPNEVRAHLLLGNLYAQQLGQPDLAREHYKQVLESDPRNPQAAAIQSWLQKYAGH